MGGEIERQGAIITTGATTGFPLYAAMGAKDECGFSIGFSPACTQTEHVETYKLPLDFMDVVVYTGFGYAGRDLLLVRSSDALVVGCGRIGTFNEFAHAAALAITKGLGSLYNPFFVYGGVGLGKTHLLHAIGNQVKKDRPDYKVLYLTSEKFVNELVSIIQNREPLNLFKEKYR